MAIGPTASRRWTTENVRALNCMNTLSNCLQTSQIESLRCRGSGVLYSGSTPTGNRCVVPENYGMG